MNQRKSHVITNRTYKSIFNILRNLNQDSNFNHERNCQKARIEFNARAAASLLFSTSKSLHEATSFPFADTNIVVFFTSRAV